MKITNAKTILLSMPFKAGGTPPWSFGGKPANAFDILLVRLETDDGFVGWGEAFSRGRDIALKQTIDTRLLPLILGRDATQISKIKHSLEFQLHNFGRISGIECGIAAIDIALWDLLGKACGQPLYRLLGGAYAKELEVYASLMRYGNVDDVVKATRRAVDRGYRYIKLHEIGLDEIRAAVKACAGKAKVMIDVNCPWTVTEALAIAKELQDLDLYWFEEPVWPPENYLGLAHVRQQGLHRIATGENAGSLHDFMSMNQRGRDRYCTAERRQNGRSNGGIKDRGAVRSARRRVCPALCSVRSGPSRDYSFVCGTSFYPNFRTTVLRFRSRALWRRDHSKKRQNQSSDRSRPGP